MHTRLLTPKHGPALIVRPLRDGDAATVLQVFARLGEASRRARFHGPKPCLREAELRQLARVDDTHHALVAWVEGDPLPAAIARLARTARGCAEIAFAVADEYQHRGVGAALASELVADARLAGITEITALTSPDNPAALALVKRIARVVDVCFDGPELHVRAAIA
ncbi:MAG: GNAT family N-acetyltransferase [Actinomycetota bacterium]